MLDVRLIQIIDSLFFMVSFNLVSIKTDSSTADSIQLMVDSYSNGDKLLTVSFQVIYPYHDDVSFIVYKISVQTTSKVVAN